MKRKILKSVIIEGFFEPSTKEIVIPVKQNLALRFPVHIFFKNLINFYEETTKTQNKPKSNKRKPTSKTS